MSITRISVLPDDRRLVLGIDKNDVFEAGFVYEFQKISGEIVVKKIGRYALPKLGKGAPACESSVTSQIIYAGNHLVTEEEYASLTRTAADGI